MLFLRSQPHAATAITQQKNPQDSKNAWLHLGRTYAAAYGLGTVNFFVGYPIDRFKMGLQLNLATPKIDIIRSILSGGASNLYAGAGIGIARHWSKLSYRTFCVTVLPKKITDTYEYAGLPFRSQACPIITAAAASAVDTVIGAPLETLKTRKIKYLNQTTLEILRSIIKNEGLSTLFAGVSATWCKSFGAWCYLFGTEKLLRERRQNSPGSFMQQSLESLAMAVPVTVLTTPPDVAKTLMQAAKRNPGVKHLSMYATLALVVNQHGVRALFSGAGVRLIHRACNLWVGHTIIGFYNRDNP